MRQISFDAEVAVKTVNTNKGQKAKAKIPVENALHYSIESLQSVRPLHAEIVDQSKQRVSKFFCHKYELISFCITVYNEPLEAFLKTVFGLFRSIEFNSRDSQYSYQVNILVDGVNNIPQCFRTLLLRLGLTDIMCVGHKRRYHILQRYLNISDFRNLSSGIGNIDIECLGVGNEEIPFIFFLKNENEGKLSSHWCYYELICSVYTPHFCLQIDVGIKLLEETVNALIHEVETSDKIGAAASCSLTEPSNSHIDLLSIWQFGSFVSERLIQWPAEQALGFLSVLPGQINIQRWEALRSITKSHDESFGNNESEFKILTEYYRGLKADTIFEKNMFLAEDRVIASDLIFRSDPAWKIEVASSSLAVVDKCDTIEELLRQRRRWLCGSLACKFYSMKSIIENKINFKNIIIMVYMALTIVGEWFTPSVVVGITISLPEYIHSKKLGGDIGIHLLAQVYSVILCVILSVGAVLVNLPLAKVGQLLKLWINVLTFITLAHGLIGIMLIFDPEVSLVILLGSVATFMSSHLVSVRDRTIGLSFFKSLISYTVSRPAFSFIITIYSFLRFHDTSWGTKGLKSHSNRHPSQQVEYMFYRYFIPFMFCISNIVMIVVLMRFDYLLHILKIIFCVQIISIVISKLNHKSSTNFTALLYDIFVRAKVIIKRGAKNGR